MLTWYFVRNVVQNCNNPGLYVKEDEIADGKYYEVESGFTGSSPRYYSIREKKSLFSYRLAADGIEVYQFDGQKTNLKTLNIPKTIEGRTVV